MGNTEMYEKVMGNYGEVWENKKRFGKVWTFMRKYGEV